MCRRERETSGMMSLDNHTGGSRRSLRVHEVYGHHGERIVMRKAGRALKQEVAEGIVGVDIDEVSTEREIGDNRGVKAEER